MYVGKAKNLKKRISQYRQLKRLERHKQRLVQEAVAVKFRALDSELIALFVEAELIREYRPEFNVRLKDDKSPIYLVLTKELFPRLLMMRRSDLEKQHVDSRNVFGPFQSAYMLRQVMRMIRPSFGWCSIAGKVFADHEDWEAKRATGQLRPCFFAHLEQCTGACVGEVDPEEYHEMIARLRLFLRGKTKTMQRELKTEIEAAAEVQEFEKATELKRQFEAIQVLTSPELKLTPDIALPRLQSQFSTAAVDELSRIVGTAYQKEPSWKPNRIECYDVSNVSGKLATVSMVVAIGGAISKKDYRIFHIRSKQTPDDFGMLREALWRRQRHPEWGMPDLVIIDGGRGQLSSVQSIWQWPSVVASLAKRPDRLFLMPAGQEKPNIVLADDIENGGKLLQQLRDEAHRFAKRHVHIRLKNRDILDEE